MSPVPSSVFLLGPDEWDEGVTVPCPPAVSGLLGETPRPFAPRHLRLAEAELIRREPGGRRRGVVMGPNLGRAGELDADLFRRLELEALVDAYFFVFPLRAKVLGTVFEGGMLLRDFHLGGHPRIYLFIERGFAAMGQDGRIEFTAKGRRTRYLESLVAHAKHVDLWGGLDELLDAIAGWAGADP